MGSKLNVVIVDYDKGNIKSLENAINHVGDFDIKITADSDLILRADIIILPGVGAFPDAMQKLKERNVLSVLHEAVMTNKTPTLGICLGMQLLFDSSEEKVLTDGLGWIPGKVVHMETLSNLRVPHIGWNSLILNKHDVLFSFLDHDKDFYFVHSFYVKCDDSYVLAKFQYGDAMVAAVRKDNIVGMQFHPEKSQKNGLIALRSFFDWAQSRKSTHHA
jgi:imidazole glycerol-phosphate synthase subunit HisH